MANKSLTEMSNEELWQLFPIILSEHQANWMDCYLSEKPILIKAIGNNHIVRINHIGSTAILGLIAKPTIDILIEVESNVDTNELIKNIESAGYIYVPQLNNPAPHMMFMKGYTPQGFKGQAYHVHVRYAGDWDELYFRDYLQSHPEMAKQYGELKLKLKQQYEHDRDGYTEAKTVFIKMVTELARKEFSNQDRIG